LAPALYSALGNSRASLTLPTEPPLSPLPVSLSGKGQKLAPASFSNLIKCNRSHSMSKFPSLFDPWAKRDAWRRHPVFSNRAMFSSLFPGFGIAVAAFSVYVLAENVIGKGKHQAVEDKHH
jgi:NADH dehydrogenase (ubiquinone) 1 beta subcomplex subunit 3